tara:strand:- start:19461 stop:19691 length:231 start_codon:yes stop_codon:yes gene_type:complete
MSSNTLDKLRKIFREYFDEEDLVIERYTSANDIEDWDSLAQVGLVITIEKQFGTKFKKIDIVGLSDIGDMVDLIDG